MEATIQGLYLTAAGMALLFLAMGVLMLAMALLARVFPVRPVEAPAACESGPDGETPPEATPPVDEGARVAALAAVAMALGRRQRQGVAQAASGQGAAGAWVVLGRQAAMRTHRQG